MTILILGGADDEHAVHMLQHLRRRGHDAELLDSRDFPSRLTVFCDPCCRVGALRLPGGRRLDLAQGKSQPDVPRLRGAR